MITFGKTKSLVMQTNPLFQFIFSLLAITVFFAPLQSIGQNLVIEPVVGLQQIYPNSFLGEDRSYSQVALGAIIYTHPGWLGFEANVFYAHNKYNQDQVNGINIGGGPSFRLNDGIDKNKISAFLSGGGFFNAQSYGVYASLRMRAKKFSYGVRYQAEMGDNTPRINVALLTFGVPISLL